LIVNPFLRALEEPNANGGWRKAPFFHTRTIRPLRQCTTADSPKDALLQCLNELGQVDPDFIAGRCGASRAETVAALDGLIYETHDGHYVTAEEYLSGDVRSKLREAEAAAQLNLHFEKNVEALKGVLPQALGQEEITARLGSGWISPDVITDFIRELLPGYKGQVQYHEQLGAWTVVNADHLTLAPGKADLSRSQRGELMSRIATGDWDLILIPHSSFTMLPVRQATVARFIEREVDQLRAYLEELQTNDKDEVTKKSVKEIERAIRRLEAKLLNTQSAIARSSASHHLLGRTRCGRAVRG
jgi:N12 class adenine-specific DNA methylase